MRLQDDGTTDYGMGQPRNIRNTRKANYARPPQWPRRQDRGTETSTL